MSPQGTQSCPEQLRRGTTARSDSSGTEGPCSRGMDGENWAEYPRIGQNQQQGYSPGVEDGFERGVSTWEQRGDGARGQEAHQGRKEAPSRWGDWVKSRLNKKDERREKSPAALLWHGGDLTQQLFSISELRLRGAGTWTRAPLHGIKNKRTDRLRSPSPSWSEAPPGKVLFFIIIFWAWKGSCWAAGAALGAEGSRKEEKKKRKRLHGAIRASRRRQDLQGNAQP